MRFPSPRRAAITAAIAVAAATFPTPVEARPATTYTCHPDTRPFGCADITWEHHGDHTTLDVEVLDTRRDGYCVWAYYLEHESGRWREVARSCGRAGDPDRFRATVPRTYWVVMTKGRARPGLTDDQAAYLWLPPEHLR